MLVLNAGSSSIKFELYTVVDEDRIITDEDLEQRFEGQVEGIGTAPRLIARDPDGHILIDERWAPGPPGTNHQVALKRLTTWIDDNLGDAQLIGVGHRVVHGGPVYSTPVVITPEVLEVLRTYISLAPLHQPHSLAAIEAILYTRPDLLQVACFDTAFHRNHPIVADQYAIPREYYEQGVRRYGFHGLSYAYIAHVLPIVAPDLSEGRVVVAHLGSGASMCAMKARQSIDSTMGFSALDGLPMGTRSGNIDPGVLLYWIQELGMDVKQVETLLYRQSGLLGLSGVSNDMRLLEHSDDPNAAEAIDYFIYRINRELGALAAALGGLDGLIFTAGIGENSAMVRERVCTLATWMGIELDEVANLHRAKSNRCISTDGSAVQVWIIPTDEEKMIALDTLRAVIPGAQ
ncbi:MAG: acetate/propionate family kinase [Chloroflexaceae bacterium]|nr:acetate/propionate family kinase [Chloroflexaceae bacterium]NJL34199.1 acetate/propionate family kinase [Chloroflexaceae bacterium]NJO04204.1 acetate/propionate family kinase [Chloroflexaceae bacterium]